MEQSETARILAMLTQLTEAVIGAAPARPQTATKRPLLERVDNLDRKVTGLDTRLSEVQLGLATLAVSQKAGFDRAEQRFSEVDLQFKKVDKRFDAIDVKFKHVDKRFDAVNRNIDSARGAIVGLVERVHDEVTARVIDLEKAGPGRKGNGGRGSGGGGVPLAS
jgi:hypothetical protein